MIQIYFLSIFFNILAGYALIFEDEKNSPDIRLGFSFKDEKSRLILGILSMAAGFLKLLSPVGNDLVILGDLLPAAAGAITGFILAYEYYKSHTSIVREDDEKRDYKMVLLQNKKIIGIAAIIISILHFLFPGILFL